MSWVSLICFGICLGIILSIFRRGADPFSPARVFGFVWSLSIALADLKLSALQHVWNFDSWVLLLTGISAFLVGTFIAYVLNLGRELVPIRSMRQLLREEEVHESRLFWLICLSVAVYSVSYLVNFLVRGWLPIFVVGTNISRVEFNVSGLTLFLFSAAFIIFFTVLYHTLVQGKRTRKIILTVMSLVTVGSYFLLLQRFQIIMAAMICFTFLFYATHTIRLRMVLPLFLTISAFSYWISSLRLSHVVATFMYSASKMRVPKDYMFLTEPYMYVVMNLENFARSVNRLNYHTYGYFTFDFVAAVAGLKYWILDYFSLDRSPYLISGYNTYTAFWWFYIDFGVIGLALIPLFIGLSAGMIYYQMRTHPTIKGVTAYGVTVFVVFISFFVFPIMHLWFVYNMLALYWILRWAMTPRRGYPYSALASENNYGRNPLGSR